MKNKVSVIVPMYNSERNIKECIESILNQSYENIEIICIDNNSKDNTFQIAQELLINHKITTENNQGVSYARNKGLRIATGRFICFLDSDDLLTKESIKKRVDHLLSTNTHVTYGDYTRFNNTCKHLVKAPSSINKNNIFIKNHIGNLTGMYDAEALGKVYQENIGHEDYEMWIQIIKKANFKVLKTNYENLGFYRIGENTLSSNKLRSAMWHFLILRKHVSSNLKIFYYMLTYTYLNIIKIISKK